MMQPTTTRPPPIAPAATAAAEQQAIDEVVALLQQPEDLARLPSLVRDYEARRRASRAAVAAAAQARVDALGLGMGLLAQSHRHIARLRAALARIDALCAECAGLVGGEEDGGNEGPGGSGSGNHAAAVRALSLAHANARRVLGELDDVVDLPARAEAVQRAFLPPLPPVVDAEGGGGDDGAGRGESSGGGGDEDFFGGGQGGSGDDRRRARDSGSSRHAGELFRAFEGLTVIEGTANNSKEAWRRSAAARGGGVGGFGSRGGGGSAGGGGPKQQQPAAAARTSSSPDGLRELNQYLACVSKAMESFERRLWARMRDFHALADSAPGLLVDAARVIEAQEAMDAHWAVVRATYVRPKHWKERAFLEMEAAISARFQPLLALARQYGRPNVNSGGDDNNPPWSFDERRWVDEVRALLLERERELAHAFDRVAPCFPPAWRVFDHVFQCYHVQVAAAVDLIGRRARRLSTAAQLALLEWVGGYQSTLRGLGVEEGLVRLPVAPMLPPSATEEEGPRAGGKRRAEGEATTAAAGGGEGAADAAAADDNNNDSDDDEDNDAARSGVALLIETYADRMEATVRGWVGKILESDLRSGPRPVGAGATTAAGADTLRTPGAVEFFRILNEQVGVLEDVSRGELLHHVARRSLAVMRAFVEAQRAVLPRAAAAPAGLELLCAFLNNNLDCYAQSIEFTDHVRALLAQEEQGWGLNGGAGGPVTSLGRRLTAGSINAASAPGTAAAASSSAAAAALPAAPPTLDVEDTCRAFLELAKSIGARIVDLVFSDEGMRDQTRRFFAPPTATGGGAEWERGAATATALATLGDYFGDVAAYVDRGFSPRVVEGCLQELVRSYVSAAAERLPSATDARLARMACDERDVRVFFAGADRGGGGRASAASGGGGGGRRRRRARQPGWSRADDDDDDEDYDEEDEEDEGEGPWRQQQQQQQQQPAQDDAAPPPPPPWLLPPAKVARRTTAIGALCGLYASPDAGGLARAYAGVLDACPESGLTPVVLERMLAARGDLDKKVLGEAAALCREAYAVWRRRERARGWVGGGAGGGPLGGGGAGGGATTPAPAASSDERGGGGLARFFFLNQKKKQQQGGFMDG